ncbi:MAG: cell division protein FtsL [Clostridia bacterium]|nr:cell division protein FtsL [Clostridia bacterium]
MNTGSNLAYDNRVRTAYPSAAPQTAPNIRIKVSKKSQRAAERRAHTLGIVKILFVMCCAFAVLYRGVLLTDKCVAIEQKQAELSALAASNEKLRFEISRALELDKVENIAVNELGMHPAQKYQTVYINLEQVDYVEHVAKNEFAPASRIGEFFSGLMEYLD